MNRKGFTLVEIISVVAIMAILVTFAGTSLIKKYNESKIEALIIQEGQLVQSGDMVIQDYCKDPLNNNYQLQCDDYYKSYVDARGALIVDETDNTYMKYICVNDLKTLEYYSEELQLSGQNCSGVVVYKINNETDLQRDSFSVIRCGDEYVSEINNQKNYTSLFSECFTDEIEGGEEPVEQEYLLTVNFTESTPSGLKIAATHSEKYKFGDDIEIDVPSYRNEYNNFLPFKHGSSTNDGSFSLNEERNKLIGEMPKNNVQINIVYGIKRYNLTINYKEYMNVPGNIDFPSTHLELFEDEKIELPYEKKTNFKIIEPASLTYVMDSSDDTVDVVYQQIEFNLSYSGTAGCVDRKVTYNEKFGTLCTPTERTGYTFGGWKLADGNVVTASTKNTYYNDIVLTPIWNGISYTITFYMGDGKKDTDGRSKLGDMQCVYGSNCKLLSFASFEKEFPYETYDPNLNGVFDFGWEYAGWTNYPDNTNVAYEDELEFVWNKDYNVSLYAIGKREFKLYSGLDSETNKAIRVLPESVEDMIQYWNPYSHDDDYLTDVKFPEGIEIDGWTFVGYKDGRSIVQGEPGIPSGNSKINSNLPSSISAKTFKPPVRTAVYIRTVYQRALTLNYDLNEGSFTDSTKTLDSLKQTDTQYYNTGIAGTDKWTTPLITSVNFTLHPRTGIQKTGHTFDGWLDGSVSGDLKEVSSSYAFTPSITDNPTKTMYVKWTGCGAGQYLAENDNQCKSCAAGTYSEGGVNSCSICPAGSYCPGGSDKVSCPSGTMSSSGSTSSTDCILYSCSSGTLTADENLGYICVKKASSSVGTYECGTESCGTYEVESSVDNCCFRCGGGYTSDYACCSACGTTKVTTTETRYCTKYCYSTSYYCPSGWTKYSGSGSTLKCYKAASS